MGEQTVMQPLANPVWVGGGLVPPDDALVHVADHGFTVGDGVFETIAVRGDVPMALDRHVARLLWSAQKMGMNSPDAELVKTAISDVIASADRAARLQGRLRITWTSGPGPLGSARGDGLGTLVVFIAPAGPWPPTARVAVCTWARNERSAVAGAKTTSYAENAVALEWAKQQGADEALFLDTRGNLSEGTGSNIVLSLGGRLLTPALTTGCLAGIARALVLEVADVAEVEVGEQALQEADGLAVLSSTRDVQPVSWLRLSDGNVREFAAIDPLIDAANRALADLYSRNSNPC